MSNNYNIATESRRGNGLAIAGFILAIFGIGSMIPLFGLGAIPFAVLGLIFSVIGLVQARKGAPHKGLAVAGLVISGLSLLIGIATNAALGTSDTGNIVNAPMGTADTTGIGTRENPAPLGSEITDGDWTVMVNSVTTVDEDSWGSFPEAGYVLLVINLTATYIGNDADGDTPWANVEYVSPSGNTFNSLSSSTMFIPENQFDSLSRLFNGASTTGNMILEVPAENWQQGTLRVSPGLFSSATFISVH